MSKAILLDVEELERWAIHLEHLRGFLNIVVTNIQALQGRKVTLT
jgi:hypothetical protein